MAVEELFQSSKKKSQVAKDWEITKHGKDPLIEFWMKQKKKETCKKKS